MNYPRFLQIKVNCPRTGVIEPMTIQFAAPDFATPLACNGCENYNASDTCHRCRMAITLMFFRGLKYFSTDIITPDFSILK